MSSTIIKLRPLYRRGEDDAVPSDLAALSLAAKLLSINRNHCLSEG